jgi:riboflavin synthase
MFTGLVEAVGEIASLEPMPPGIRMRVQTALGAELVPGDSLAVNGVCLTVVSADKTGVQADVSPETARVTTLGTARCGTIVNLERPLRADGRLGGHFVQGHVDATAAIDEIREDGDSRWMTVRFPQELASYIVRKGSIAVNGVSLTVAGVDDHRFGVQVIPYTWTHTNFHALKAGDAVNLECDVLAKYVARALGRE